MAGRWMTFGQYGAEGVPGKQALARQLDELLTGIVSEVTTERGLHARLKYLTASPAGYAAMARAGIDVTPRTLMRWLSEEAHPTRVNLTRIDAAYWDLRRRNVAKDLKGRLNARGRGTRMEIYPVEQRGVIAQRRRDIPIRSVNVRLVWDDMVDAWLNEDERTLDEIWDDIICDLDSSWDAYSYVTAVGFGA
ncbi:transcriptional regulator [Streptomyces sp. A7024]|uniref:Transcriptional regulator n=1 Tax=Streptomyces coryli TaxID=1128680 RepID=A0A6G4U695_9ACTN|nr:transcriptional regulator [Streptomyces coryli]NGN67623.1 transcriptional regulator [Streptomyces coryli]